MTLRSLALSSLFAASLFAASAQAHDPDFHDYVPAPAAKAKPSNCKELADTKNYSADLADKALKTQCKAEAGANEAQKTKADDKRV